MNLIVKVIVAVATALAIILMVTLLRPDAPRTITIAITPFLGSAPFEPGKTRADNPGGDGEFTFEEARIYLSNLVLRNGNTKHVVPDSYHLIVFNEASDQATITIQDVFLEQITHLEFGVGVDPKANGSIESKGDLDPNSRMAWSWDVGYKFILLEGKLVTAEKTMPLVYHVGFDENYTRVTLPVDTNGDNIPLKANLLSIFAQPEPVDMQSLSTVKFDRADSKRIAAGFAGMFSPCPDACD